MRAKNKGQRIIGAILFSVGLAIGFFIFAGAVWADFEAAMFDTAIRGDKSLSTLRCPVVINDQETGTVSAAFHNPLDRPVQFAIRTRISQGFVTLMREERALLPVDAGGTERLEWTVTPEDAAYDGKVILVKVLLQGNYPLPSRQAMCGVLVLSLPFLSGSQALALGVAVSLLLVALGGALWLVGSWPLDPGFELDLARGMGALAASMLVGMFVGFMGSWLLGVAVVVITALMIVELIRHVVQGS
jgi:hypothetical protein